jgi:hypothetical protein
VLYFISDVGPADSQIVRVLADGTYAPLGPMYYDYDLESIDISPITGEMYVISGTDGNQGGNLWHVDKTTGALTLIGNTGAVGRDEIMSCSFDPNGVLWAFQEHIGLVTVDLVTAQKTLQWVPPSGIGKNWEGLAWDLQGRYLYGSQVQTLYRWDPVTRTATIPCGTTFLPDEVEALDTNPAGELYGGMSEMNPANMRIFKINPAACTLAPGGYDIGPWFDIETLAFENPRPPCAGVIGDYVWTDLNGNGLQDFGEPGIGGVTLILKKGADVVTTTTTDASGHYAFTDLCAATYTVIVDSSTLPPGVAPSLCNAGMDDSIDNDCSPATVTLPDDATTNTTVDFGYLCGCDDGNRCTIDTCDATGCVHTPESCDDGNLCTTDSCDPLGGCAHAPVNVNDNNLCTVDSCDPETGVHHDPLDCDNHNACNRDTCDPQTGCVHTTIDCDDHNKCTNDSCNPDTGCVNTPVNCDDGSYCTTDACDPASGCSHRTVDCSDGDICTNDYCNPTSGCVNLPASCDDGNACTADHCNSQTGCTNTLERCDDLDACTTDSCDPVNGCIIAPIGCDDGDPCTLDTCDVIMGCLHTPVNTDDENACTADSCDAGGVHHTPISCDDGSDCTTDSCDPATGCHYNTPGCDDHNACTQDRCLPQGGCVHDPVTTDDGDACTTDACDPSKGVTHTPITCNDQNACTSDTCDPESGCVYTPIACNDQNACTTDTCLSESGCQYTPITCNDNNPCTADSCSEATGCVYTTIDPAPAGCGEQLACRITGGGQNEWHDTDPLIDAENTKATFGGQVGSPIGHIGCFDDYNQIQGNWTYHRHKNHGSFQAKDYNSLVCGCDGVFDGHLCNPGNRELGPEPRRAPANMACFNGVGDYNPSNGNRYLRVAFRIEVEDRGEPGAGANAGALEDVHKVRIWIPKPGETAEDLAQASCCTIPNANLTIRPADIDEGGSLIHGNIQIHPGHNR